MKIKKGDNVIIITGKSKGQTGTVGKVFPATGRLIVTGANKVTRRQKAKKRGEKGQTVEVEAALNASNVMLLDGKKRIRVSKRSAK